MAGETLFPFTPMAVSATGPLAAQGAATAGAGTILGMSPANFAAIAGLLASAIAPKGSAAGNLGAVSTQIGQSKLTADAAELQDAKNKAFMKEIIASMGKKDGGMTSEQAIATLNAAHTPLGGNDPLSMTPKSLGSFANPTSSVFDPMNQGGVYGSFR